MSEHSGVAGKTPHGAARSIGAAKRQAARDERTIDEQLALLNERPGRSERERVRLGWKQVT